MALQPLFIGGWKQLSAYIPRGCSGHHYGWFGTMCGKRCNDNNPVSLDSN